MQVVGSRQQEKLPGGPSLPMTSELFCSTAYCLFFLIGCGLSGKTVMQVGWKPVLQGLMLWLIVSVATLVAIIYMK